jgi:hypothetical protein
MGARNLAAGETRKDRIRIDMGVPVLLEILDQFRNGAVRPTAVRFASKTAVNVHTRILPTGLVPSIRVKTRWGKKGVRRVSYDRRWPRRIL